MFAAPAGLADPDSLDARTPPTRTAAHRAWAFGLATVSEAGAVLDVWYPDPATGGPDSSPEPEALTVLPGEDPVRDVRTVVVHTVVDDLSRAPTDAYDAYCGCTCCHTGWSAHTA